MAVFYLCFIPRVARRLEENQIGDKMGGQRGVGELADKTGGVFFMRPVRKIYQVWTWPIVTFVQSRSRFFFAYSCICVCMCLATRLSISVLPELQVWVGGRGTGGVAENDKISVGCIHPTGMLTPAG